MRRAARAACVASSSAPSATLAAQRELYRHTSSDSKREEVVDGAVVKVLDARAHDDVHRAVQKIRHGGRPPPQETIAAIAVAASRAGLAGTGGGAQRTHERTACAPTAAAATLPSVLTGTPALLSLCNNSLGTPRSSTCDAIGSVT